ncbi:group II intron maturase-specific domain-containing protein (plasmid) [Paraburkholderia fungorum]
MTASTPELLESMVLPWVRSFLGERGLKLSVEKTRITQITEGFDFLGWNVRKFAGKLLIRPSLKNVRAFYSKVQAIISQHKMIKQIDLIHLLNPVLRGWANYHDSMVAKRTFQRLDSLIFRALWRWARRRHSNRHLRWVKAKYFLDIGTRHWQFAVRTKTENGAVTMRRLYQLADTPIRRHIKVRGTYNPYDRKQEMYSETLRQRRMTDSMRPRKQFVSMYRSQRGNCASCGHPLTRVTGWHDHHIVYRTDGGSDVLSNRVLLHPVCHARVHALNLSVVKPAHFSGVAL